MKWKLSLAQKVRTGAALVVVFLLVLATNMMDSNHFKIVQKSLTTVYEDRLLAKDYIYKISRQLEIKKRAQQNLNDDQLSQFSSTANDSIKVLISKFEKTKLTERESLRFESLKQNLDKLVKHERALNLDEALDRELSSLQTTENFFLAISNDLDALSQIQIDEGKRELDNSRRTINTSNLISRLEIALLIVIGLLIQMLIFIKPFK